MIYEIEFLNNVVCGSGCTSETFKVYYLEEPQKLNKVIIACSQCGRVVKANLKE